MNSALIIIDRAPYGCEDAFSGLYVAIACLNNSLDSDVLLIEDGVYAAVTHQMPGGIGYPNVEELTYLIFPEGSIFVHEESLKERGLVEEDLVEAAEIIDDEELYEILMAKDDTAILKI
ncbi:MULTISPECIES: DsrE family protein [Methanothermobacter]|uniref:DsrE family protein n=1 Tax=Methanothermobacter TaxID=145260 RepID=UPI001366F1E3|nr:MULTISPECIES: DsrE family protein [Methanothermobacter]MDI6702627.1 DsrE family protein [Methanothermobacter wolfeii]MDI6841844.1 DsrE family protein [Methanothermobacter wolfeii]QHN07048.1 sulfur reduction protein DsrE [Methanothermobacter sp. THM-1]